MIACVALSVPPPDLKVPPPASLKDYASRPLTCYHTYPLDIILSLCLLRDVVSVTSREVLIRDTQGRS